MCWGQKILKCGNNHTNRFRRFMHVQSQKHCARIVWTTPKVQRTLEQANIHSEIEHNMRLAKCLKVCKAQFNGKTELPTDSIDSSVFRLSVSWTKPSRNRWQISFWQTFRNLVLLPDVVLAQHFPIRFTKKDIRYKRWFIFELSWSALCGRPTVCSKKLTAIGPIYMLTFWNYVNLYELF